jgi:hypothetical protein
MPQFRVSAPDGTRQVVRAGRVRRHADQVIFENRSSAGWSVLTSTHRAQVQSVQRKVTELNGTERWITQPIEPSHVAAAPSHYEGGS